MSGIRIITPIILESVIPDTGLKFKGEILLPSIEGEIILGERGRSIDE